MSRAASARVPVNAMDLGSDDSGFTWSRSTARWCPGATVMIERSSSTRALSVTIGYQRSRLLRGGTERPWPRPRMLAPDDDQERSGRLLLPGKGAVLRTAWRAGWLLSWTTTSSHDEERGGTATRDCASWCAMTRAMACASM